MENYMKIKKKKKTKQIQQLNINKTVKHFQCQKGGKQNNQNEQQVLSMAI